MNTCCGCSIHQIANTGLNEKLVSKFINPSLSLLSSKSDFSKDD